jgi:hypothetical protein
VNFDCDNQKLRFRASGGRAAVWGDAPARMLRAAYVTERGEKRESLLLLSGWWGIRRDYVVNYREFDQWSNGTERGEKRESLLLLSGWWGIRRGLAVEQGFDQWSNGTEGGAGSGAPRRAQGSARAQIQSSARGSTSAIFGRTHRRAAAHIAGPHFPPYPLTPSQPPLPLPAGAPRRLRLVRADALGR